MIMSKESKSLEKIAEELADQVFYLEKRCTTIARGLIYCHESDRYMQVEQDSRILALLLQQLYQARMAYDKAWFASRAPAEGPGHAGL